MDLTTRIVTTDNFSDLVALIDARGGPHYCWCMAWRDKPAEVNAAKGAEARAWRRRLLRDRVDKGAQVGLLAYRGKEPVGWCSAGPLAGFRRLGGPKPDDTGAVWAISCFYVPRRLRKQGIAAVLAAAAVEAARAAGAKMMQVTPVDPASPSYHFMGTVGLFESLGFQKVGMAGTRRHVMQLSLAEM